MVTQPQQRENTLISSFTCKITLMDQVSDTLILLGLQRSMEPGGTLKLRIGNSVIKGLITPLLPIENTHTCYKDGITIGQDGGFIMIGQLSITILRPRAQVHAQDVSTEWTTIVR